MLYIIIAKRTYAYSNYSILHFKRHNANSTVYTILKLKQQSLLKLQEEHFQVISDQNRTTAASSTSIFTLTIMVLTTKDPWYQCHGWRLSGLCVQQHKDFGSAKTTGLIMTVRLEVLHHCSDYHVSRHGR